MGIRRPQISKKFEGRRFALLEDRPIGFREAQLEKGALMQKGKCVRVVRLRTGYFVYYWPQ